MQRAKREFCLSFLGFIFSVYACAVLIEIADLRGFASVDEHPPLVDFALSAFPDWGSEFRPVADACVYLSWLVVIFAAFLHGKKHGIKNGFDFMSRFLRCISLLYFLRGICIVSTIIPPIVDDECRRKRVPTEISLGGVLLAPFNHAAENPGSFDIFCFDYLPSGHVLFTTAVSTAIWYGLGNCNLAEPMLAEPMLAEPTNKEKKVNRAAAVSSILRFRQLSAFAWLITAFCWLFVFCTRMHYTVDVVVGASLSFTITGWTFSSNAKKDDSAVRG